MKKFAIALVVLIVIALAGGQYLWSNLDSYVKEAIETYGSAATQAKVSVSHVSISLTTGQASLGNLSVGSPPGFNADKALDLGSISVTIDTSSITASGPIVIKDITVDKPDVTYEVVGNSNNLDALSRNAQKYAATPAGKEGVQTPPKKDKETGQTKESGGERKIIIDHLSIRDGDVTVIHPLLKGRKISSRLPAIEMKDIGRAEGGATPAEIAQKISSAIARSASESAMRDISKQLGSLSGGALKDATKAGGGLGGKVKGLFGK